MRASRRQRAGAVSRAAMAAVPAEYFAPERAWLAQRGPQLAALSSQVKMLTALVNAEKQFVDVSGNVNPSIAPVGQYLTGVAEGDDTQGRQGRSIRVKELDIALHFYSATAATTSQSVRVFVVKDNLPQGSVPSVGTLFEGGVASVDAMPVLSTNQGRFKWLFDEVFQLGTLAGGNDAKYVRIRQKLDHHVDYIGTTGGTTSAGAGTLWLYVLTDTTAGNASTGTFYSRVRYYDN